MPESKKSQAFVFALRAIGTNLICRRSVAGEGSRYSFLALVTVIGGVLTTQLDWSRADPTAAAVVGIAAIILGRLMRRDLQVGAG